MTQDWGSGSKLALSDVVALRQFVELLFFPSHVIELAQVLPAKLVPEQARDEVGVLPLVVC